MRNRINTSKICNSDNYESSVRAHKNMLKRNHTESYIVEIPKTVVTKKRYYTKVFGKIVNIEELELPIYEGFTIYTY